MVRSQVEEDGVSPTLQAKQLSVVIGPIYENYHFIGKAVWSNKTVLFDLQDGVSPTLQARQLGVVIGPIWKKTGLSASDVRRIHKLYKCSGSSAPLCWR